MASHMNGGGRRFVRSIIVAAIVPQQWHKAGGQASDAIAAAFYAQSDDSPDSTHDV